MIWHFGEDKNANGQYEPKGMDGVLGTADDEFDPNNPTSHPDLPHRMTYHEAALYGHDADFDGVMDSKEDKNLNGIYEPLGTDGEAITTDDETDFLDRDTDDDGLTDGFELGRHPSNRVPFNEGALISLRDPDSDNDGLPDGLECGITQPVEGFGYVKGIDVNATFEFQGQQRKTFIKDLDPGSMTHLLESDTNGDGVSDGAQDLNANGRFDPDEDEPADPAIGFVGFASLAVGYPHRFYEHPAAVAPQTYNDVMAGGTDVCDIAYQAASDAEVPNVVVSDTNIIDVRSIERLDDTRFWIITIEWVSPGLASFKVTSQSLPGGETPPIRIETFEIDAIYDSDSWDIIDAFGDGVPHTKKRLPRRNLPGLPN